MADNSRVKRVWSIGNLMTFQHAAGYKPKYPVVIDLLNLSEVTIFVSVTASVNADYLALSPAPCH